VNILCIAFFIWRDRRTKTAKMPLQQGISPFLERAFWLFYPKSYNALVHAIRAASIDRHFHATAGTGCITYGSYLVIGLTRRPTDDGLTRQVI
jgi:hypothetical protein